jgi:hypothetical protein
LIVVSVPVTPEPAVAGPFTGGQYVAHAPLQFEVVAVSGANEYSVKPLALVSTVTPPIVAVFRAVPDELAVAEAEAPAAAGLPGLLGVVDELPHAAAISATATSPKEAHSTFLRIGCLRSKRDFNEIPVVRNAKRIGLARTGKILQTAVRIGQRGLPVRPSRTGGHTVT